MLGEFNQALAEAAEDNAVKVVIVAGAFQTYALTKSDHRTLAH